MAADLKLAPTTGVVAAYDRLVADSWGAIR
jgi:hypothetical protein